MTNLLTLINVYYVYFKNIILWCRLKFHAIAVQPSHKMI